MEGEKDQNQDSRYISLFEAAKLCSYSEPYLRLRSRQGKLKSIKLGKRWMTSRQWLDDYEARVCQWRAENESRKIKADMAANVAADKRYRANGQLKNSQELNADVKDRTSAINDSFSLNALPERVEGGTVSSAVLCSKSAHLPPPAPPRRQLSPRFGGQIIPAPKENKTESGLNHGAVAAVAGGSLAAFLLFFAVQPRSFLNSVQLRGTAIGQANISQPAKILNHSDVFTREDIQFETDGLSLPTVKESALKNFVSRIADFFDFSGF